MKTQVDVLKGRIHLQSAPNVGTTFSIMLPGPEDIENQMFFENECAQLYFDARTNCINIIWKRTSSTSEYREIYETLLQTVSVFHSPGWIADLRNKGEVSERDQDWFLDSVLPEGARSGLKRNALVCYDYQVREAYYSRGTHRAKKLGIEVRFFETMDEAKSWMQTIFLN